MRELAAQAVLLVKSFEEADPEAALLRTDERQSATDEARAAGGSEEERAERRATLLIDRLEERLPGIGRVRTLTRLSPGLVFPLALVAFAIGMWSDALGPERRVNLLAFPLIGLLLWNLFVYVLLIVWAIRSRASTRASHASGGARGKRWRGLLGSLSWWLGEWSLERVRARDARRMEIAARALGTYWTAWTRVTAELNHARVRLLLHIGAASLALGAVGAMYVNGLVFEYRASWESTFLTPNAVAALLHVTLGPVAAMLGESLPDPAALATMSGPEGSSPAAPWIHMWAVTTAAIVIVPRLILASIAGVRAAALAQRIDVDPHAGSFRVLLAPDRGAGTRVDVHPYSYRLGATELAAVRELARDVFGLKARFEEHEPLAYGDEARASADGIPAFAVVVFGLVQSPEREVHGHFLESLLAHAGHGVHPLVLVDASTWRDRFGDTSERRLAERVRAWDRMLRDVGLGALHVDLGKPLAAGTVERAESLVWPSPGARAGSGSA